MVRVNANHHHVLELQIERERAQTGKNFFPPTIVCDSSFIPPPPSLPPPHGYLQCPQLPSKLAVQLKGNLGGHTHEALRVPDGPGLDALGGN